MLPKRHAQKMFTWIMLRATHTRCRGEVDSRTGCITLYSRGRVPRPWRKVMQRHTTEPEVRHARLLPGALPVAFREV